VTRTVTKYYWGADGLNSLGYFGRCCACNDHGNKRLDST
jgi:hypothetical protein